LFSIGSLDFRGARLLRRSGALVPEPPRRGPACTHRETPDQRTFLIDVANGGYPPGGGFDFRRDIHQSVGGGLRFFLRSVAVPLIGLDAGYGLESRGWRITLVIGA
jgi:hypothetical protein